jgi:hypothetical protein
VHVHPQTHSSPFRRLSERDAVVLYLPVEVSAPAGHKWFVHFQYTSTWPAANPKFQSPTPPEPKADPFLVTGGATPRPTRRDAERKLASARMPKLSKARNLCTFMVNRRWLILLNIIEWTIQRWNGEAGKQSPGDFQWTMSLATGRIQVGNRLACSRSP